MAVKTYNKQTLSDLSSTQTLQNTHNPDENALDMVGVNSLVPRRYSDIALMYAVLPNAKRAISRAIYYGRGAKAQYRVTCRGSINGSKEQVKIVAQSNVSVPSLDQKYFIIYDTNGSVGVWYRYNPSTIAPTTGANRDIMVTINTEITLNGVLSRTSAILNADSEFNSTYTNGECTIENSLVGDVGLSYDVDSGFNIRIIEGLNPIHNSYWFIYSGNDAQKYHVWYNVDGTGIDPDPDPGVSLPLEVALLSIDTNVIIAEKTTNILKTIDIFDADFDRFYINITIDEYGTNTPIGQGNTNHIAYDVIQYGKSHVKVADLKLTYDINSELTLVQNLM